MVFSIGVKGNECICYKQSLYINYGENGRQAGRRLRPFPQLVRAIPGSLPAPGSREHRADGGHGGLGAVPGGGAPCSAPDGPGSRRCGITREQDHDGARPVWPKLSPRPFPVPWAGPGCDTPGGTFRTWGGMMSRGTPGMQDRGHPVRTGLCKPHLLGRIASNKRRTNIYQGTSGMLSCPEVGGRTRKGHDPGGRGRCSAGCPVPGPPVCRGGESDACPGTRSPCPGTRSGMEG